ncbi:MAG TPA: ABC transporter permease subunit [Clostridiales bacterium]|nr:ABC transporter permease subunit [Clostridiales bacterium]
MDLTEATLKKSTDQQKFNRAAARKDNFRKFIKNVSRGRYIYLLMLPGVLYIFIFNYIPIYGLQIAFKEFSYSGSFTSGKWIGLVNFRDLVTEVEFWRAFKNTIIISFMKIALGFPIPMILAILINEVFLKRYKRVLQTVLTFPHFLSWIVIGGIAFNLLANQGAINNLLSVLGLQRVNFLMNPGSFRYILVYSGVWKEAGWSSIIYLAAITNIEPELYEAATVDGANRYQKMWYITWSGIKSMVVLMLIMSIGGMIQGNFLQVFFLYNPVVYSTGDIIDTYVYRLTFQRGVDFSFTTAVGLFKGVVNLLLLLFANFVARRYGNRGVV